MPFLPSITALRCLDASAQLGSFTRAAQALHLTQSAVSHHILNLEHQLGVRLFDRESGRLQLTEAGRTYWSETLPALEQLKRATNQIALKGGKSSLTISVPPSFTQAWLMERVCHFVAKNPDITLNLVNRAGASTVGASDADAAIELSDGSATGISSVKLLSLLYVPYASSSFLQQLEPDRGLISCPLSAQSLVRVLRSAALIRTSMADAWEGWLALANLSDQIDPLRLTTGPIYAQASLALIAVLNGTGVAMLPKHVVKDSLRVGTLTPLSTIGWPASRAYRLQWAAHHAVSSALQRFADWALSVAESETD